MEQEKISCRIKENYKNHKNTLVYAVCGAGKTELVFGVIEHALSLGHKVGFSIPRKDVVIELSERLANSFKNNKVVALYGGNTIEKDGDIIVLTTHQLYRYEKFFDLLILDEIDAFPYKDNDVLHAIFLRSVKGNYCLMSATPSEKIKDQFNKGNNEMLTLFHRFHHYPLPVPEIKIRYSVFKIIFIIKKLNIFIKENKPVLVFCATIKECEFLFNFIKTFVKGGNFVHSKRNQRSDIIEKFRLNDYKYLVTTSVLERGVTLKNLQVIIYNSDHELYNSAALIQISGRVGRVKEYPNGKIYYVAKKRTKEMVTSIETIKEYNKDL